MSIASWLVPGTLLISFASTVQVLVLPYAQGAASWLLALAGLIIQL